MSIPSTPECITQSHSTVSPQAQSSFTPTEKERSAVGVGERRKHETYLEHSLKRLLERPLPQPRSLKLGPPKQIGITEYHLHGFHTLFDLVLWKDVRSTDEAVGEDDVDGELDVEGPVSRVVEYEDSTEGSGREVGLL